MLKKIRVVMVSIYKPIVLRNLRHTPFLSKPKGSSKEVFQSMCAKHKLILTSIP